MESAAGTAVCSSVRPSLPSPQRSCYFNSLSAPFIFDDEVAVVANPAIRSISGAWSQPRDTPLAGRPVAALTFAINFAASDVDPAAYRATNIAIHIACALVFFGLLRRTLLLPRLKSRFGGAATDLAFGAALLWAVHPLTTDAVTYITQRTESLMALCYLSTLYASLRSAERRSPLWAVAAVAACAIGMGAKESMATAPLMVILYDRIFLFDSFRAAAALRWRLYLGLMLTWLFLAFQLAAGPRAGSAGFSTAVSVWTYLLNQSVMICRYLRLAAWPTDLAITYGAPVPYALSDVLLESAVVVALVVVDRGRVSPMAGRRVSRCVVLHDAGALIELRSDRNRGRRRTTDVSAADGHDDGRRRGSL